jgi:hypothetical protein
VRVNDSGKNVTPIDPAISSLRTSCFQGLGYAVIAGAFAEKIVQ